MLSKHAAGGIQGLHKPPKGRKCAKHGFLFLLDQTPRSQLALKPKTMLRTSEAQVGWRWRFCPWRAACLLSMVFIWMGSRGGLI